MTNLQKAHAALLNGHIAILARIHGNWDEPALVAFGALSTDTTADLAQIAGDAIKSSRKYIK